MSLPRSPAKPAHDPAVCRRLREMRYHNRSHSDRFQCDTCGRHARFNLNWLGNRKVVVCVGTRFERREANPGDRAKQMRLV